MEGESLIQAVRAAGGQNCGTVAELLEIRVKILKTLAEASG
jgi:hypothetical protein